MPGKTAITGNVHAQRGFTRWAVLVALVIVGLLAVAVGPRLFGDVALTEIATAKAQVAELGKAVEQFHQDTGRYPRDDEGLDVDHAAHRRDAMEGPLRQRRLVDRPMGCCLSVPLPANPGPDAL